MFFFVNVFKSSKISSTMPTLCGRLAVKTPKRKQYFCGLTIDMLISYLMVWNAVRKCWELPGGQQKKKKHDSETPLQTARRETKEETGFDLDSAPPRHIIANRDGSHHIYVVDWHFYATQSESGRSMRIDKFKNRESKSETSDFGFVVKEGDCFVVKNFSQTHKKPNSTIISQCTLNTLRQLHF